ncbi:unnamed protein product [Mytilus coruscus]|uniref:Farnesoic acid O-methyl transferase domain-containing protein n=1 Tax=Mytilus coruscus TaxID=42192 RepID=A0A6J8A7K1_MYTCO|nr:unnamed protein product [Mytilus coruscus]
MNYTIDINRYNLDLSGITSLLFKIKACDSAHVLLSTSDVRNSSKPLSEIIMGYFSDSSYIIYRAESTHDTWFSIPNILNCTVYLPFWISWASGDIELGTGVVVGEDILGNLKKTNHFEVRSIGVFTDRGTLGNWTIQVEVSDKFAGYFDSCSMSNTKSDVVVVDDIKCSGIRCATICGMSNTCMGFNFNSVMKRCELLSFGSNVVTDIPHHTEDDWRFYSKCYNRKTACLGCY